MAKVTAADIKNLGFTKEMFRKDTEEDFEAFITGKIERQANILPGDGRSGKSRWRPSAIPCRSARGI